MKIEKAASAAFFLWGHFSGSLRFKLGKRRYAP
jgi:hypothetical protein